MMIFPIAVGRWPQTAAISVGAGAPTAPAQFGTGDWSVANDSTGGDITITITALPSDGGSAITDLEYQLDGGSWVSLGDTTTGDYPVSGLTDDQEYDVAIRAVNAIGNGTASATKAVTPTTGDPHFASVVLLVSFDGVDGSTTATDDSNSAHTLTFGVGEGAIDTAQSKFGSASALFDGTNDRVFASNHADFAFGDQPFTIEAWVRFSSVTGALKQIVGKWGTAPRSWTFYLNPAGGGIGITVMLGGVLTAVSSTWSPSTNTWYHVCAERDGADKFRLYADGVMVGSATHSGTIDTSTKTLRFGCDDDAGADFAGWIDEPRITKGVARYATDSSFTVPTAAFPRS